MRRGRRARISPARKKTLQSPIRGSWRADASARIAAGCLFLAALLIAAAALTADKLPAIAAVLECEVGELYDEDVLREASEAARTAVAEKAAADAQALAAGK